MPPRRSSRCHTRGSSSAPAGQKGLRRIACAIDFSPASLKALRYAGGLAEACRSTLLVTHVLESEMALAAFRPIASVLQLS